MWPFLACPQLSEVPSGSAKASSQQWVIPQFLSYSPHSGCQVKYPHLVHSLLFCCFVLCSSHIFYSHLFSFYVSFKFFFFFYPSLFFSLLCAFHITTADLSLFLSYSLLSAIPTPSQQGGSLIPLPSSLNLSGSLPDLSSLHLPSPQPTGLEVDPLGQATCLASSSSSDHLPGGLTHPGLKTDDAFHLPGIWQLHKTLFSNVLFSWLYWCVAAFMWMKSYVVPYVS